MTFNLDRDLHSDFDDANANGDNLFGKARAPAQAETSVLPPEDYQLTPGLDYSGMHSFRNISVNRDRDMDDAENFFA